MKNFKSLSFIICILVLSSNILVAQELKVTPDERGYIVKVGDQIADFSVTLSDGSQKKLSEFNSKVIVLNFFASWCSVCRKEIPHIEKEVWQHFKDKDVTVIGVDFKEKLEIVQPFVEKIKMTYPIALDIDGAVFAKFAQGGVTRNIVLDENLNIIFLTRLFDEKEFANMIDKINSTISKKKR